jgi:hypothetical protein
MAHTSIHVSGNANVRPSSNSNPKCFYGKQLSIHPVSMVPTYNLPQQEEQNALDPAVLPLSTYCEEVVKHIAGWLTRKLAESLQCLECRQSVIEYNETAALNAGNCVIINFRDNGGLFYPSTDIVCVCCACESVFKNSQTPFHDTVLALQSRVFRHLSREHPNLFLSSSTHFLSAPDHRLNLLSCISKKYFTLRKFHAVRLFNNKNVSQRSRFLSTKNILFNGE